MDDIDFLKSQCDRKSIMFFVDSAKRDRNLFPNPNEYAVLFSTPFRNVCKLQVMDASIPRTQYNIESYNNTFVYTIIYDNGTTEEHTIVIDIGDYDDLQLIDEMNKHLVNLSMDNLSNPGEKRKQFIFKSRNRFQVLMNKSTMKDTLGFDFKSQLVFNSVDDKSQYVMSDLINTLNDENNTIDIMNSEYILYQRFYADTSGYVDSVSMNIKNVSELFVMKVSLIQWVDNHWVTIGSGISNVNEHDTMINVLFDNTFLNHGNEYYLKCSVFAKQYADSVTTFSVFYHLTNIPLNTLYIKPNDGVVFTPDVCSDYVASGFKPNGTDTLAKTVYGFDNPHDIIFRINARIVLKTPVYSLISPCMYNLIGERYIMLKCKEVEENNTTQRTFHTRDENDDVTESQLVNGIAKFKLGVTGYQDERFDYNSIPSLDFHPIGRLSCLTFRFEKANGELYDFKGINHTLTLLLEYFEPKIDNYSRLCMNHLNPQYQAYMTDLTNPNINRF